ncbi:D-alanyl-D-alanine carboxypeptidase/D-alanyl-D-alanine endopeptidase [Paenisporosarcina sp. TG-14]|uniref:D-alanyl-D-alanine carboxypeptidase/D-alanyl-D-alanine endopeptidase n=1 Tax=Paenisporosarcina sp. TG-14 TaxID=1231057 RepID=UPI0002E08C4C|nr:D-alanyl-D-alanine carboxypeptidase/D-alanyl-D-alanine-endopeptidase [Paenisporosarcina sp. TG-14]
MKVKKIMLLSVIVVLAFLPFLMNKNHQQTAIANVEYAQLGNSINKIIQDERLDGATTGISIRKAATGELIYDHFGDTRLHPASNMKLLTAAVALETLGEEYRFVTEVLTDGHVKSGVLQGNLYLKGKGDPTLLTEDFDLFAQKLASKGIKIINGNLVGDDTWYDNVRLSQDINWTDESYYYAAQVSALTASPNADFDAGTVIVEAHANSKVGKAATINVMPPTDMVKIINRSKTVASDGTKTVKIEREHGTNNIVIEGVVPEGGTVTREWITISEPSYYALDLFGKSLTKKGITFAEKPKLTLGKTPRKAQLLTSKKSITLKELLIPFMKLSNNSHADILAKEMGKVVYGEGSFEKGLQVIEENSAKLGLDKDMMMIRDASGMSHINLIPANEVTNLLVSVQKKPWYNTFLTSLPVAGVSKRFVGGTLRNRMKIEPTVGNVKAKTGTITAVSALSGYATTRDGELLAFSILINNDLSKVTPIEDQIATAIASYTHLK